LTKLRRDSSSGVDYILLGQTQERFEPELSFGTEGNLPGGEQADRIRRGSCERPIDHGIVDKLSEV
jgi:hypothetical protein